MLPGSSLGTALVHFFPFIKLYSPPWGLVLGKFLSNTKLNKAKTVTLLPAIRLAQSILISPSKRAFEKHMPRVLFSEFYGISFNVTLIYLMYEHGSLRAIFFSSRQLRAKISSYSWQ